MGSSWKAIIDQGMGSVEVKEDVGAVSLKLNILYLLSYCYLRDREWWENQSEMGVSRFHPLQSERQVLIEWAATTSDLQSVTINLFDYIMQQFRDTLKEPEFVWASEPRPN